MANFTVLQFPDRPQCFVMDDGIIPDPSCGPVTTTMLDFLNITDPASYLAAYCLNPPSDSCAFGFCPNPDIAGPAVRWSTYVTNICLAIVILYSPDDVKDAFNSQVLTIYSLIISAIIAIATKKLTRLHALFALFAAASPLSIYLVIYALRSIFGDVSRLNVIFGNEGGKAIKWRNRLAMLFAAPLWIAVLIVMALPHSTHSTFQQEACDIEGADHFTFLFIWGPLGVFLAATTDPFAAALVALLIAPFVAWAVALVWHRHIVWNEPSKRFPFRRMWTVVMDKYPLMKFCIIIGIPHFYWFFQLEIGSLFDQEIFEPTYGQLLAIFIAIPPVISLLKLTPRLWNWFKELTWVRFITCRRRELPDTSPTNFLTFGSKDKVPKSFDVEAFPRATRLRDHAFSLNHAREGSANSFGVEQKFGAVR